MQVYLVRHSRAVDEGPKLSDEHRYLSADGRRIARAVGRELSQAGVRFDAVLSSPLVRAVQTAELLGGALGYEGTIEALVGLSPGVPPRTVIDELAARGVAVAVVGHEPTISALGALLVQRPSFPPFRPGQVTLIERGAALWQINPETLERSAVLLA